MGFSLEKFEKIWIFIKENLKVGGGVLIEELALDESNQVNHLGDICLNYHFIVSIEAPQRRCKFSGQEG